MANNIQVVKKYVTDALDEVYKMASLTAVLDGDNGLVSAGANAGELIIPKLSMDGLGDYSGSDGYPNGDVSLTYETVKANFDRGRMFQVDSVENADAAGIAFTRLGSAFVREKVTPELDAFRLATYAGTVGITSPAAAVLSTSAEVLAAVSAAWAQMSEDEVPVTDRFLFITPTLHTLLLNLDLTKSRETVESFAGVIEVPQTRFYTAISQLSGKNDEKAGGYTKASGAKNINFLIVHKDAVAQFNKHVAAKVVTPDQNQNADAWKLGYRNVSVARTYDNKVKGIYLHKSTT